MIVICYKRRFGLLPRPRMAECHSLQTQNPYLVRKDTSKNRVLRRLSRNKLLVAFHAKQQPRILDSDQVTSAHTKLIKRFQNQSCFVSHELRSENIARCLADGALLVNGFDEKVELASLIGPDDQRRLPGVRVEIILADLNALLQYTPVQP